MPSVPSSISLTTILDGAEIIASSHRNNYAAIQTAVNGLQAVLGDVSAKGDLLVATADDTLARLAVGSNGQVLKANSATATGLEWGASAGASLSTTLPGSPANGDEVILVDSLSAPTYQYHLKYVSAASTYKWYCIGAVEAMHALDTAATGITSTSYVDPSQLVTLTTPVAGDWIIEYHARVNNSTAMSSTIGIYLGTAPTTGNEIVYGANTEIDHVSAKRKVTGLSASTVIKAQAKVSTGTLTLSHQVLSIRPFRVG